MGTIRVYDPTTGSAEQEFRLAPRPESLRGLRIGLVENTKYNSSALLLRIAAILEKEYGAKSHLLRSKRTPGTPVDERTIAEFKTGVDVAIAGIGDWGSCSSGSVLDGILLERGGVPAVSIVTDLFVETGEAMAKSWGVPGYQFLSLLHPIANLTDWELDQRARDIVPKIVELLRK